MGDASEKSMEGAGDGAEYHIVLFYMYTVIPEDPANAPEDAAPADAAAPANAAATGEPASVTQLEEWLRSHAEEGGLLGRVVLASEGINGNLASAGPEAVRAFCDKLQALQLFREKKIDFKYDVSNVRPFPDLHVVVKKEICSTGSTKSGELLRQGLGGKHLSPQEFHEVLDQYWGPDAKSKTHEKELVVIDVRNNIEHKTGLFRGAGGAAVNPGTKTFARFGPDYAEKAAEDLKGKKVLMYCTGGIRCETASAALRSLGCDDVSQLNGGIHRYIEQYGAKGYFQGSNFVFDSRTLQKPSGAEVVGRCQGCEAATEAVSCDRVCAVCREPVLVCDGCRVSLFGVYYCDVHMDMKGLYEPFLERFSIDELEAQKAGLLELQRTKLKGKPRGKAVSKQVRRIDEMLERKRAAGAKEKPSMWASNPRCRSCGRIGPQPVLDQMGRSFKPGPVVCDGACTGFLRSDYEDPRQSLDDMNRPEFAKSLTKKRKRTQRGYREFAKRMRKETDDEYGQTRYVVLPPAGPDQPALRTVEPYLFRFSTHVKKRWKARSLLETYCGEFSGNKRAYYRRSVEAGLITVNDKPATIDQKLAHADLISNWVHRHEPPVQHVTAEDMIVAETDRLLVVDKPASITVHASGAFRRNSLTFILAVERGLTRLFPVHRLDRLTSGLVIIAKDADMAKQMMEAMQRKTEARVHKAYLARVEGRFPTLASEVEALAERLRPQAARAAEVAARASARASERAAANNSRAAREEGDEYLSSVAVRAPGLYAESTTNDPMLVLDCEIDPAKAPPQPAVRAVLSWPLISACQHTGTWRCLDADKDAEAAGAEASDERPRDVKSSMTRIRALAFDEASNTTLVQCEPVTGRSHQLRVHLSFLGHPIVDDPIYGTGGDLYAGKTDRAAEEAQLEEATKQQQQQEQQDEAAREAKIMHGDLASVEELRGLVEKGDVEAACKKLCVACNEGEAVAFKSVQRRVAGIHLHAFRYCVELASGIRVDHSTRIPRFAVPFVAAAAAAASRRWSGC